ncbi:MAG: tetratricopeptide repeat protein [Candidatus Obscuribacterales bacterium]|nr:tetratricopeptide repeat protein [Candidatus Obscuribacterales bacterium]
MKKSNKLILAVTFAAVVVHMAPALSQDQESPPNKEASSTAPSPQSGDPYGFKKIGDAMDEFKSKGSVSPETRQSLREIQERGERAKVSMDKDKVGRDDLRQARNLLSQKQYKSADAYFRRSLEARQRAFGANDVHCADPLSGLADTYERQGWRAQAIQLYSQAIQIEETSVAKSPGQTADALAQVESDATKQLLISDFTRMAKAYEDMGKLAEAESTFKRALPYAQAFTGPLSPFTKSDCYSSYSRLLHKMHREAESKKWELESKRQ